MKQILWRKIAFWTLLSAIVSGSLAMGFTGKLPSEPQDKVKTLTSPDGERTNLPEASVLEGTGKVVPKKAFSMSIRQVTSRQIRAVWNTFIAPTAHAQWTSRTDLSL